MKQITSANPKYSIGTKVRHGKKWGRITEVWFDEEQWRYSVRHSGLDWSVPESSLAK